MIEMVNATARKRWLRHAEQVLREAHLRTSTGRSAVMEVLAGKGCLISAQEIVDHLRDDDTRSASIATVYRALETLHAVGLVRRLDSGQGIARYEPIDPSGDHHHHVVFDDGTVKPFEDRELERAIDGLSDRLRLHLTGHDVILRARHPEH
jgi:Fur family ferric uptake transcriptional regulator